MSACEYKSYKFISSPNPILKWLVADNEGLQVPILIETIN